MANSVIKRGGKYRIIAGPDEKKLDRSIFGRECGHPPVCFEIIDFNINKPRTTDITTWQVRITSLMHGSHKDDTTTWWRFEGIEVSGRYGAEAKVRGHYSHESQRGVAIIEY